MKKLWTWLASPKQQKTLAFIGGGLVVVGGALWQAYLHVSDQGTAKSSSPPVTAIQGGIAAGRNIIAQATGGGITTIQTGPGTVHITQTQGIDKETYTRLAEELGVTLFKTLEQQQVPSEDLDSTLREIAPLYRRALVIHEEALGPDHPNRGLVAREVVRQAPPSQRLRHDAELQQREDDAFHRWQAAEKLRHDAELRLRQETELQQRKEPQQREKGWIIIQR